VATPQDTGRREAIVEAAAIVISERGVDAARMADIAEQAGVSLGLVQHYFRHRDRLLEEVFSHELERIALTWASLVDADAPPLDRLIDYLALCVPIGSDSVPRQAGARWGFWIETWSKGHRDAATAADIERVYARFAVPFTQVIEEGIAGGLFTTRGPVADTVERLIALIDGLAVQTLLAGLPDGRMLMLLVDAVGIELQLDPAQSAHARARAAHAAERLASSADARSTGTAAA
jgi:AcrR family transcriptional regulator